jgi:hypothetical protein
MKQQTVSKTDMEMMVRRLVPRSYHFCIFQDQLLQESKIRTYEKAIKLNEDTIQKLREERAKLQTYLNTEKEVCHRLSGWLLSLQRFSLNQISGKLTFEVTATQALCNKIKESIQIYEDKLKQSAWTHFRSTLSPSNIHVQAKRTRPISTRLFNSCARTWRAPKTTRNASPWSCKTSGSNSRKVQFRVGSRSHVHNLSPRA